MSELFAYFGLPLSVILFATCLQLNLCAHASYDVVSAKTIDNKNLTNEKDRSWERKVKEDGGPEGQLGP